MTVKEIKHEFMAYRNGVVADTLRQAGMPYSIIFGLNVPQLAAIARPLMPDHELARELWADRNVRESRLLACYLFDPKKVKNDEALALAAGTQTREEADMLVMHLLSKMPDSTMLLMQLEMFADTPMLNCADALRRRLAL